MPKSITLGWKEYRELLQAPVDAEERAVELQQQVDELKRQRKASEKDVTRTETYRTLHTEYAKVRDIVKVQKELETKALTAERQANAAARQLAAANEQLAQAGRRMDALSELLTEARYLASDYARRTRPNIPIPRWLTVAEVLTKKANAAKDGRVWTVQGYLDGSDD